MFATKQSPYNIVDATPFKRDVLKELADACAREGIKLHLYYSHIDWTRPTTRPAAPAWKPVVIPSYATGRHTTGS